MQSDMGLTVHHSITNLHLQSCCPMALSAFYGGLIKSWGV